jgi:AcrR family transcriptional regulator
LTLYRLDGIVIDMATRTRLELLEAAYRVVREEGISALTLDAVAAGAGVSKGGVLYHFPSKAALFEGMLAEVVREEELWLERCLEAEPEGRGRALRAYVRAAGREEGEEEREIGGAILAAIAADPAWSRMFWPMVERWRRRVVEDGTDPALAMAVMAAADGLCVYEALGVGIADRGLRRRVLDQLIVLAGGGAAGPPVEADDRG